ncbi:MAG: hypothetical protein ACRBB2_08980 [Nitrosopumilus sp.]
MFKSARTILRSTANEYGNWIAKNNLVILTFNTNLLRASLRIYFKTTKIIYIVHPKSFNPIPLTARRRSDPPTMMENKICVTEGWTKPVSELDCEKICTPPRTKE